MKYEIEKATEDAVDLTYAADLKDLRIDSMRAKARELALTILESTPLSREQALAMSSVEHAAAFAIAAIDRHERHEDGQQAATAARITGTGKQH